MALLFVVVVGAFPGLKAFGWVAVVGLNGFPQVLDGDKEGNQEYETAE